MAIELSLEEIVKIEKQTLSDERLADVTYYNITAKADRPISRDFEAFLILQTTEQKQESLKWIKESSGAQARNKERDQLIVDALERDTEDTAKRLEVLDEKLTSFNEFKESITSDDKIRRFISVQEVSAFLRSIERTMDEVILNRSREFHNSVIDKMMQTRHELQKVGEEETREVKSWQRPFSEYEGQSG
jgi:hypothetical protein